MTKKDIKFKGGVIKQMTFEEVLKQFDDMMHSFANEALEKIVYNKPEREEIMQELRLQTWVAYEKYNGKHAFSTYLHYRLQHGIGKATSKLYAKKRTNKKGITSLNEIISGAENDTELEDLLGEDDFNIDSLEFIEFVAELEKQLDPCEIKILRVLMDKNDYSVQNLADELGMSRQGANKKVNKFKEKMANILIETGYIIC